MKTMRPERAWGIVEIRTGILLSSYKHKAIARAWARPNHRITPILMIEVIK